MLASFFVAARASDLLLEKSWLGVGHCSFTQATDENHKTRLEHLQPGAQLLQPAALTWEEKSKWMLLKATEACGKGDC